VTVPSLLANAVLGSFDVATRDAGGSIARELGDRYDARLGTISLSLPADC